MNKSPERLDYNTRQPRPLLTNLIASPASFSSSLPPLVFRGILFRFCSSTYRFVSSPLLLLRCSFFGRLFAEWIRSLILGRFGRHAGSGSGW
jgi:hypothetical protein